jgi:hypothetical protein
VAGSPEIEEAPKLGLKATIAGLVFALVVLGGFSAATAASYEDDGGQGDEHGEELEGDDHGESEGHDADDGDDEEHSE